MTEILSPERGRGARALWCSAVLAMLVTACGPGTGPSPGINTLAAPGNEQPPPAMYTSMVQLSLSGTISQSIQGIRVPVFVPVFFSVKVSTALWRKGDFWVASSVAFLKIPSILPI